MTLKTKSIVFNFLGFAVLFTVIRFLVLPEFTNLTGVFLPLTAFVVATLLAPKFQAIKTGEGEKLFMKWLFTKGVKEIK
ncbi:hypothetical protein FLJC2902T_25920 [Flavobacterium limnosediminis JC2902]|uniref:Uncharacterized protein n=1 Tax=Flavobacterium limnosediminis JC2902 TaxID=1341181 RepID=V6SIT6_9FLAO|nr:hypothetical protein [Flavobacterium limnosediminis]ESU26618.1 hypothetical protein FLJC2902T_25920 [Flavobacterium limnosediminis JC2902]